MINAVEMANDPTGRDEPVPNPFSLDVLRTNGDLTIPDLSLGLADMPKMSGETHLQLSNKWISRLPKVSRKLLESPFANTVLDELPEALARATDEAMSTILFGKPDHVRCRLDSIVECDLMTRSSELAKTGSLAFQIVLEQGQSWASAVMPGGFVRQIINRILGSADHESSNRPSPIETAIAEFLAARVLAHINDRLGGDFFSVGEVTLAPKDLFTKHEAGAQACIEMQFLSGEVSRSFQILATKDFLSELGNAAFITDASTDKRSTLTILGSSISVPLRTQIGFTRLSASTISFLEPGDVVIIDESQLDWNNGSPRGQLQVLAGDGANFAVTGDLDTSTRGLRLTVNDISSWEAVAENYAARLTMEENQSDQIQHQQENESDVNIPVENGSQIPDQMSESLEKLQVRLRVELAGNRVSLRELNSLRVGQVIDLDRGLTDSVNLITDGSDELIAAGELVDIDGRLGVRLTKVFL